MFFRLHSLSKLLEAAFNFKFADSRPSGKKIGTNVFIAFTFCISYQAFLQWQRTFWTFNKGVSSWGEANSE